MKNRNNVVIATLMLVLGGSITPGMAAGPEPLQGIETRANAKAADVQGTAVGSVFIGQNAAGQDMLGIVDGGGLVSSPEEAGETMRGGYEVGLDESGASGTIE